MAMQMPYDDVFGNHYDTSYWRLVQLNLGIADKNAQIIFNGYKDETSRAANKRSIGTKGYVVSGYEFDALMTRHLKPGGSNVMQLAYKIAGDTKDVVVDPEDPTKNKSFFDAARDLL